MKLSLARQMSQGTMGEIYHKTQLRCNDDYTDCLMLYLMLPLNKDLSHKIIYSHKMTQPVTLISPEEIVKFSYIIPNIVSTG